jgi:hypothetical protein
MLKAVKKLSHNKKKHCNIRAELYTIYVGKSWVTFRVTS